MRECCLCCHSSILSFLEVNLCLKNKLRII
nr:MAG TPA: hypothetical protein [Caudoviricetes sp.]